MDPASIEGLKRDWTGRRVVVVGPSPSLRRFSGQTGTVVTINMNGRALVRFDSPADIGWYDIAILDLRVVVAPPPPEETAPKPAGEPPVTSATKPEVVPPESPKSSVEKPTGKPRQVSILELARRQGPAK